MIIDQRELPMLKRLIAPIALNCAVFVSGVQADTVSKALVMVNSSSLQTQGMAMVLANAMQAKGVQVSVLLCDQAGDLALKSTTSTALKPRDVTPVQLMGKLQKGGASINVCALYLPNSEHEQSDLRDGVGVAKPPAIAGQMIDSEMRVFSF